MGYGYKITKKKMEKAIDGSLGLITNIASRLGVERISVYRFIEKYPEFKEKIQLEKDKIVERAETGLFKRVNEGDWNAIRYILNRLGKDKGYTLKNELSFKGEVQNSLSPDVFAEAWKQAREDVEDKEDDEDKD